MVHLTCYKKIPLSQKSFFKFKYLGLMKVKSIPKDQTVFVTYGTKWSGKKVLLIMEFE